MKKISKIKRFLIIALIFLFSINSFATAVSDNDGSAFITKAEFDALKSSFQSQIDTYNNNIDSKIDTAIASYLSGIRISKISNRDILVSNAASSGVLSVNVANPLTYKTCLPVADFVSVRSDILEYKNGTTEKYAQPGNYVWGTYVINYGPPSDTSKNKGNKTVIKNLDTNNKIAAWEGYHEDCIDIISGMAFSNNNMWGTAALVGSQTNNFNQDINYCYTDIDLLTEKVSILQHRQYPSGTICIALPLESIVHDWGTQKYPLICVNIDYNYDLFSNYERDYNWSYPNTCGTKFILPGTKKYIENETLAFPKNTQHMPLSKNVSRAWDIMCGSMPSHGYYAAPAYNSTAKAGYLTSFEQTHNYVWTDYAYQRTPPGSKSYYVPIIGFETAYLTKWNDIYMNQYDSVMNDDTMTSLTTNTILTDSKGIKHLSSCAGFPLLKINKDEKLTEFKFSFDDPSAYYDIWFKEGPFDKSDPNLNSCMSNISGYQISGETKVSIAKETVSGKTNAYKVSGKETTISIPKSTKDSVIFVKWQKINVNDRTKDGGGTFKPASNYTVENESD